MTRSLAPILAMPAISQADAVRAALDAGHDMPRAGVAWIKATHGIDVDPGYFSAVKVRQINGVKPRQPRQFRDAGSDALLVALESLKPVVASLGAERTRRLVDLLG